MGIWKKNYFVYLPLISTWEGLKMDVKRDVTGIRINLKVFVMTLF